ncbi:MAG: pyridoxamine 5'-phosphate oxidase family protein [Candidatus Rokuibacteriota bacterium]
MITLAGTLTRLEAAVKERGVGAYVMTVAADGRPHVTWAPVRWEGAGLVAEVGTRTALNARTKPMVTLLFPVRSPDDYSLIVDGSAAVEADGQQLFLTPTRAVLHRPGALADPTSSCGADCVPLFTA